jgi:hypothetical protein
MGTALENEKTLAEQTERTFPFPGFGRLGFIEEALALVQRFVVRIISPEWIPRAVRCCAIRLFCEWVSFCELGGDKSSDEEKEEKNAERAYLVLKVDLLLLLPLLRTRHRLSATWHCPVVRHQHA